MKGHGPPDALVSPRFAGSATFLSLPVATDLAGVDMAIFGLPFDTGATFRVGARGGLYDAFAPGTGTPECGGPTSAQALALLRACRGLDIAGADVVEVLPDLDPSHITGTLAATVAYEVLTLIACARATSAAAGSPVEAAS